MTKAKGEKLRTVGFAIFAVLWVFVSVVTAQLVLGLLLVWMIGAEALNRPVWSGIYSILTYVIAIFLSIYVLPKLSRKWRTSREELGLNGLPTWTDIGLSPVGFIVGTLLAAGLTALFNMIPWFDAEQVQETGFSIYMNGGERIMAFFVLVVVAPVMEEIIFRGWLYGKLRSRMGAVAAVLIASLVFGVMHFQWNVGVNVFALSVVLCVMREVTGTIYAGILAHMIKNGVAFYLLYVLGM
ncbi:CPBP family intramembrane metalloprotease [Candidatus Saccharibacteria bacterium]|nr:CPBP family intramembrane metalloprotease [Candidatus Saccharibacteria bacterium]